MKKSILKNFFKQSIICTLIIALAFSPVFGLEGSVEGNNENVEIEEEQDLEYEKQASSWRYQDGHVIREEMPMLFKARSAIIPWSKNEDGKYINSQGKVIEGAIRKGVDVSAWQEGVNWSKVKAAGIDFAIIRCGYGDDMKSQDDTEWLYNVKECERLGIPYGIYIYSYANADTSCTNKAKSEAAHVLRCIKEAKADPDYPIYYDLEDDSLLENYTKDEILKSAVTFCDIIEDAGYPAGIYANLHWWNTYLTSDTYNNYERWVAQFNSTCDYDGEYRIWQCTSSGTVSGINELVDINFEFQMDKPIAKPEPVRTGWYTDAKGNKYYYNSSGAVTTGYNKIGDYYYLFDSSGVMKTGTVTMNNKQYKLFSSGVACIHTAKTKTSLNYRTGPGTSYKKKGTYKKGKVVSVIQTKNGWSKLSNGYWIKSSYTSKVTTYPKTVNSSTSSKSYKAKTTTSVNYRTGPSTSYKKKGTYKKGKVITIKSTKNGWGKMSNGYWIKLSYTKKV